MKKLFFVMSLFFAMTGIHAEELPFELTTSDLPESTVWYYITIDGKYVYSNGYSLSCSNVASPNKEYLWAFVSEGKENFYIFNRTFGSESRVYAENGIVKIDAPLIISKTKGRKFKWERKKSGISTIYTKDLFKNYVNLKDWKIVYDIDATSDIRFIKYGSDKEERLIQEEKQLKQELKQKEERKQQELKQEEERKQAEERKKNFCILKMPQSQETKYDSTECLSYITYLTDFKKLSEITELKEFGDSSMFASESVRLGTIDIYNPNPYCLETKDGSIFVLDNLRGGSVVKMFIKGNAINFPKEYEYSKAYVKINGENCLIDKLDKAIGINDFLIFKGQFDNEKKYNASGIYKSYRITRGELTYVMMKDGQPLQLPLDILEKGYNILPNIKAELRKIFNNPESCSFVPFNKYTEITRNQEGYMSELMYHGKDYTKDWQNRYESKRKKAAASEKAKYLARCKKYGKKYVDIRDAGYIPVVGMPFGLALEYGLVLKEEGRGYKVYKIYGCRCELTVRNGRVSHVITW